MSYSISFTLPGLPKTVNAAGRAHWAIKAAEAKKWRTSIQSATINKAPETPLETYTLTLIRHSSAPLDYDNLVASFKHVADGLIDAGIIKDDKLVNSGPWNCNWERAKRGQGYVTVKVCER